MARGAKSVVSLLLVEDEPAAAKRFADEVAADGIPARITYANSRDSAVEAIDAGEFDIVVCGPQYPPMDGGLAGMRLDGRRAEERVAAGNPRLGSVRSSAVWRTFRAFFPRVASRTALVMGSASRWRMRLPRSTTPRPCPSLKTLLAMLPCWTTSTSTSASAGPFSRQLSSACCGSTPEGWARRVLLPSGWREASRAPRLFGRIQRRHITRRFGGRAHL